MSNTHKLIFEYIFVLSVGLGLYALLLFCGAEDPTFWMAHYALSLVLWDLMWIRTDSARLEKFLQKSEYRLRLEIRPELDTAKSQTR